MRCAHASRHCFRRHHWRCRRLGSHWRHWSQSTTARQVTQAGEDISECLEPIIFPSRWVLRIWICFLVAQTSAQLLRGSCPAQSRLFAAAAAGRKAEEDPARKRESAVANGTNETERQLLALAQAWQSTPNCLRARARCGTTTFFSAAACSSCSEAGCA